MNAPKKSPLDSIASLLRRAPKAPARGRHHAALRRVDREQVAVAAVRPRGSEISDPDPDGAVADQPLVRARSRADALADRVARRAGPRGVLHRLGHARCRGSLPDVGRHRRPLHRPRVADGRALLALAARSTCSATVSAARSRRRTSPHSPSASRRSSRSPRRSTSITRASWRPGPACLRSTSRRCSKRSATCRGR